jgi:hypothetical protein
VGIISIASLICLVTLFGTESVAEGSPWMVADLTEETRAVRDALLGERERVGLAQVAYDSTWSAALQRRLPQILGPRHYEIKFAVSALNLDEHVYDWNKRCFLCRASTTEDVVESLLTDSTFAEALRAAHYTHLITAATGSPGNIAVAVCLSERLVEFGACRSTISDSGGASVTITGHAPGCDWIRFVFYKGIDYPQDYAGTELMSKTVGLDRSGYFEVTLPISRFGGGEYRIAAYVSPLESKRFNLAAWIPYIVK